MFIHINSSISNTSVQHKYSFFFFVYIQLIGKTVLFQTIHFHISTQFSSISPIDRTLSGATTPGQSGSGSDGNKGGVHRIH